MIKTNFTRVQVLELMEYLDNRKDDDYLDTYQEELDYYVAEKQVNNINYTHSCKSDSEQLEAVEDLKEWAYDNCNSFTQERLNKIIERL
mgnify:CR=1 FL=1